MPERVPGRVPEPAAGAGGGARPRRGTSLRARLLWWLIPPLLLLQAAYGVVAYRKALASADLAYDRTLLASARNISERVSLTPAGVRVDAPYISLDTFEVGMNATMYYRVSGVHGEFVSGYRDLPPYDDSQPRTALYPALVSFYDAQYRGEPVRVAALHQPVMDATGAHGGMALIEVAETVGSRQALTRKILFEVLWGQLILTLAAVLVIWLFTRRALAPLDALRDAVAASQPGTTTPLPLHAAPREALPLVQALNGYMGRLDQALAAQRRFIADAAHQLRTPVTVLRTQAQLAARETDPAELRRIAQSLADSSARMAALADQLLSSARAADGAAAPATPLDLTALARQVCLELMPAARARGIDLGLEAGGGQWVAGTELLHELLVNLVDNALRHAAQGGTVTVRTLAEDDACVLEVEDDGPGIPEAERDAVLEPFYRGKGAGPGGSGLGLTIVREIATAHGAALQLRDGAGGRGLRVRVAFSPAVGDGVPRS